MTRIDRAQDAPGQSQVRFADVPVEWRIRAVGMCGTTGLCALILLGALITWRVVRPVALPAPPLVVTFEPLAAPPEPMREVPEGPPEMRREHQPREEPPRREPPPIIVPPRAAITLPAPPPTERVAPAPATEATTPRSLPLPPADRPSSQTEATWEAHLLAHLERYRRYPMASRARREQGVVYVRFRMNRRGAVLASQILRSSGSATLDRAALDTLRRAQPLPSIPADRPDELELTMPVEFFVRR